MISVVFFTLSNWAMPWLSGQPRHVAWLCWARDLQRTSLLGLRHIDLLFVSGIDSPNRGHQIFLFVFERLVSGAFCISLGRARTNPGQTVFESVNVFFESCFGSKRELLFSFSLIDVVAFLDHVGASFLLSELLFHVHTCCGVSTGNMPLLLSDSDHDFFSSLHSSMRILLRTGVWLFLVAGKARWGSPWRASLCHFAV